MSNYLRLFVTIFSLSSAHLGSLSAAEITVSNTDDSGAGSLRQAITAVNASGDASNTINITATGTITLNDYLPLITNSVNINGSGAGNLTVSGNSQYRVFFVNADGKNVNISNMTIADGQATGGSGGTGGAPGGGGGMGAGGGVFVNQGNVTLSSVNLNSNHAVGGTGGNGSGDINQNGGAGGGGLHGNGAGNTGASKPGVGGGGGGFYGNGGLGNGDNTGGNGGGGGGGGFAGNGGAGNSDGAGGGGGGLVNNGLNANGTMGGAGSYGAAGGTELATDGASGTVQGGGGGAGVIEGQWGLPVGGNGGDGAAFGGGGGGGAVPLSLQRSSGGDGGFGGGGGGSGEGLSDGGNGGDFGGGGGGGGNGGFGGGGGSDPSSAGTGGFGGGGGGNGYSNTYEGAGGAYGGNGGHSIGLSGTNEVEGGGGGGAGLGGAIFVRSTNGATLTLENVNESGSSVTGGAGGTGRIGYVPSSFDPELANGGDGEAHGSGLFLMGGTTTIQVENSSSTIAGDIFDHANSTIEKTGNGNLILSGQQGQGLTKISEGTIEAATLGDVELAGGTFSDQFQTVNVAALSTTADYTAQNGIQINADSLDVANSVTLVVGDATMSAGSVVNNGTIRMSDALNAKISSPSITNNGMIRGSGNFQGNVNNAASGTIRLTGGDLQVNILTNNGLVQGLGNLTANASDSDAITNNGTMQFGDPTTISGNMVNNGTVLFTGGSGGTVAIFDNFKNNGTVETVANSAATFFGNVSGSGDFTGLGNLFFAGGFSPGNSPGEVYFAGDVTLQSTNELVIEISGLDAGIEFDLLSIDGEANLGGTLDLNYLAGFTAERGDSFQFLTADGGVSGTFSQILFPDANPDWFIAYETNSVIVGVVPETSSIVMLLLAFGASAFVSRKRLK